MSLHEVGLYGMYSDARRKGLEKGRLVGNLESTKKLRDFATT